jgi:hypothetical protein
VLAVTRGPSAYDESQATQVTHYLSSMRHGRALMQYDRSDAALPLH